MSTTGTIASGNPAVIAQIAYDLGQPVGAWGYYSGINGTVTVATGRRVVGISAFAALGGTITINGGPVVTLPIGVAISISPNGNLTAPTIVFTGTSTYFVETVI